MYAGHIIEEANANEIFKSPKHPYTKALIKALPDFNTTKLEAIEGQPPSIKDSFKGCPFEPRCKEKITQCATYFPLCKKIENYQDRSQYADHIERYYLHLRPRGGGGKS